MVALSVLDLSVVREGAGSTEALAETTRLAQAAERLGFLRFWVAEHHNMPTVASTSPAVLIAHIAASTERIRVGSGGAASESLLRFERVIPASLPQIATCCPLLRGVWRAVPCKQCADFAF